MSIPFPVPGPDKVRNLLSSLGPGLSLILKKRTRADVIIIGGATKKFSFCRQIGVNKISQLKLDSEDLHPVMI